MASYGADPRRIPYAGNEADGLTINYKDKYAKQLQSIKDNYKAFDQPYNGKDNDDYVNGQGFCCNDGTPEAAQARAIARTRAANGNFKPNDDYEKMQFYYHPDHLGSSSYITNLDGEVAQHIEYVPFGEVFIEERNNTWNTPYLFNAKELDEETGMYYYGARYYEPRLSLWISCDPKQGKYPYFTTYCYALNNPIKFVDPDGEDVFVSVGGTPVGTTTINLSSSPELKKNRIKGVKTMEVPVYKVTVSNESGSTNTYYYTRIGYRKDVNKQSTPAREVTFDVRKDGDTFAAVIKNRWGKKNNVLELRDPNKLSSQTVKARIAKEKADRTAIQFHVKGATDGCLLSVGANNFKTQKPGIKIRKDLPLSSSAAQVSFMNDIMRFQKEDKGNRKGTDIKVSFKQIYTK